MTCITSCNLCENFIKTTNVAITGTAPNQVLTLTIPSTVSLVNLKEYCLVICQAIPSTARTMRVAISNGTTTITDVRNRKGNYLRADEIRTRKKYKITYGNDPVHITFLSPVCRTSFVPTVSVSNGKHEEVTETDLSINVGE